MSTSTQSNTNIVTNTSDINTCIGKVVYLLIDDTETLIASTRKSDIDMYLRDSKDSLSTFDPEYLSNCLIYGVVLDPKSLPYKISPLYKDARIWLLRRSIEGDIIEIEEMSDVEAVASWIEYYLEEDDKMTINSFSVIVGHELELMYQIRPHSFKMDPNKVNIDD